mmetsp:Transcript_55981/g.63511  ORF Transcript_55981/g.63511 Transcript_55981/m.63511 type:complete len:109 (+) Transcript_55981:2866-3192(+)
MSLSSRLTMIRSFADEVKYLLFNDEVLLNGDDVGVDDNAVDVVVGYRRSAAARTEIKDRVFNNCMVDVILLKFNCHKSLFTLLHLYLYLNLKPACLHEYVPGIHQILR